MRTTRSSRFPQVSAVLLVAMLGGLVSCAPRAQSDGSTPAVGMRVEGWTGYIEGKPVSIPKGTMGDEATLARIIEEGTKRNQVMNHLSHLTGQIGSRLSGSNRIKKANDWQLSLFQAWGLSNARLDQWGTVGLGFDRGPSSGKALMAESPRPQRRPGAAGSDEPAEKADQLKVVREMQLTTLSWTRGTDGPVRGQVVKMPKTDEEFTKVKESLKGAWVLLPPPSARGMRDIRGRISDQYEQRREAREKIAKGESEDKLSLFERVSVQPVAGYISSSRDERVWTGGLKGWRELSMEKLPAEVHVQVRLSDYDYLNSRLTDGDTVYTEFDLKHEFTPGPVPVYNVIAEIPGTEKPEEVIFISGHTDSWDGVGSQGATDNGTGTCVTLEAARILMAAGAKPKRTIRFALWSGEEQGLLGSDSYVQRHKDEWPMWSACFVDDGGTNSQGGLGASSPEMAQMLAAATAPTNGLFFDSADGKPLNVNIRMIKSLRGGTAAGGSDHASFNKVGVPGFFWDEVGRADYGFGWHTQNDRFDLAVSEYLKQSATNSAITAYRLACAETLLPRDKPPEAKKDEGKKEEEKKSASPAAAPKV